MCKERIWSNIFIAIENIDTTLAGLRTQRQQVDDALAALQKQVVEPYLNKEKLKTREKALQAYKDNTPQPVPQAPPTTFKRKAWEQIPKEVASLVVQKVFYEGSVSWKEAKKVYGVSKASLSRLINKEKKLREDPNSIPPTQKRGRKTPLNPQILSFILMEIEKDSQITLADIVENVEKEFHIQTSDTAIDRALRNMEVTWKNVLPMLECWNSPEVIEKRMKFVQTLASHRMGNRDVYYVDETGFNLHIKKSKGRAPSGEKAMLTLVPKGKRITLISCIGKNGFVHTKMVELDARTREDGTKGTNAKHFKDFLSELIDMIPRHSLVILDNCKIHRAELLDNLYNQAREFRDILFLFLSPYSPFFNPIEYAFNKLKTLVAGDTFKNRGELKQSILRQLPNIDADDAEGFYRQSAKYYPQALMGLPFIGKPLDPEIPNPFTNTNTNNNNNQPNNTIQQSMPTISSA